MCEFLLSNKNGQNLDKKTVSTVLFFISLQHQSMPSKNADF